MKKVIYMLQGIAALAVLTFSNIGFAGKDDCNKKFASAASESQEAKDLTVFDMQKAITTNARDVLNSVLGIDADASMRFTGSHQITPDPAFWGSEMIVKNLPGKTELTVTNQQGQSATIEIPDGVKFMNFGGRLYVQLVNGDSIDILVTPVFRGPPENIKGNIVRTTIVPYNGPSATSLIWAFDFAFKFPESSVGL